MSCYIVVDVETDGPIPHKYSMVSFGAVVAQEPFSQTFYGKVKPISPLFLLEALAVSNTTRELQESYDEPEIVMHAFADWIVQVCVNEKGEKLKPVFVSDNNGFDWQFINYYFHIYLGYNPFGYSSRRIGDLYAGYMHDISNTSEWKETLVKTKHSHHPVDDAKGNAEAWVSIVKGIEKLSWGIKTLDDMMADSNDRPKNNK